MKTLDLFSKRILTIAISLGIVFSSVSLFLFSLTAVSRSFAKPLVPDVSQNTNIKIGDYTIIGVIKLANGKAGAVGYYPTGYPEKIKVFTN